MGAYDRAGSVFESHSAEQLQTLSEMDLEILISPVKLSDFTDSYLGEQLSISLYEFYPHAVLFIGSSISLKAGCGAFQCRLH